MAVEILVDLYADEAPKYNGEVKDKTSSILWSPIAQDVLLLEWLKYGVVDKEYLVVRESDLNGNWIGAPTHRCLPDRSCCVPNNLWDSAVRESYLLANDDDRMLMLTIDSNKSRGENKISHANIH